MGYGKYYNITISLYLAYTTDCLPIRPPPLCDDKPPAGSDGRVPHPDLGGEPTPY